MQGWHRTPRGALGLESIDSPLGPLRGRGSFVAGEGVRVRSRHCRPRRRESVCVSPWASSAVGWPHLCACGDTRWDAG